MLKSELIRIFANKKSVIFIILIFLIPFIDLISNWIAFSGFIPEDYILQPETGEKVYILIHPAIGSFLSGTSGGHVAQMLLIWLLPIYLLLIYGDFFIKEKEKGYSNIIFSKYSRNKFLKSRFSISFLLPFALSLLSLLLNFSLACIIFNGGKGFLGLEVYLDSNGTLLNFSIEHPYSVYLIYIFVYSLIAGGCGVMCTSLSFLFPSYKYVYPLTFFIWIIQIVSPYSITYVMQPFIEYSFDYIIPALGIFTFIVLVLLISSGLYKVKCDER